MLAGPGLYNPAMLARSAGGVAAGLPVALLLPVCCLIAGKIPRQGTGQNRASWRLLAGLSQQEEPRTVGRADGPARGGKSAKGVDQRQKAAKSGEGPHAMTGLYWRLPGEPARLAAGFKGCPCVKKKAVLFQCSLIPCKAPFILWESRGMEPGKALQKNRLRQSIGGYPLPSPGIFSEVAASSKNTGKVMVGFFCLQHGVGLGAASWKV